MIRALCVSLALATLPACAALKPPPETRVVAIPPGDGVDPEDIDRGAAPRIIQEGEDYRIYGDLMYGRATELWGALGICSTAIRSADAAAERINAASRE